MRSKENRKFLLLCLLMLLLCTSCASSSQNADGSPLEFFNRRVLENPEWTLKAVTELGKYRAESICSDGEHLYVLCREQNQILKLDADGEFLGFIGSVGSQLGQLYQPAAMAWDGQYLIVAEQGNLRLQAFTPDGASVFTRPLPVNAEQRAFVRSVAPCGADYLVCLFFPYDKDADTVWRLNADGTAQPLMKNVRGIFTWNQENVYLLEDLVYAGEENVSCQTGAGTVWRLDAGALVRQAVLPYGYVATSAVPGDGRWYAVNSSFYSLDCFDSAWQYVSTGLMLANQEKNVLYEGQSLSLARCKGQLMLLSTSSGTLYRVQENAHDAQ